MPIDRDPTFDRDAFHAVIGKILAERFGGDGTFTIQDTRSGTFNLVVKLTYGARRLGVRLALNQQHFRYERDLIKEVFAVTLLRQGGADLTDERAAALVKALMAEPRGTVMSHEAVRTILHYDWSMRDLPYPFFVFEWVEGKALWEEPSAERYHAAGRALAGVHKVRFEHFYENILIIHERPRSWRDHLRVCLNRELARAGLHLPAGLSERLEKLDFSRLDAGRPCLVHNDYSGANIIIDPAGAPHIIDWDNWVVDCAELDLVKMKYWTAIGVEGWLTHRPDLYAAFLDGYRASADLPIDEGRLRAYEYLWLLRCFNFEISCEATLGTGPLGDDGWRHVYPRASYYLDLLESL